MSTLSKIFTATTAAIALGGAAAALASPASAASRNGVCESGEFCYYYNSNNAGSVSDFTGSVANYGTEQPSCYDFRGRAAEGLCIKNEAASVWNRSSKTVRVYYNSNYGGTYQDFKAGAKGNLNSSLKNQNASHQFSPSTRTNMSYALYKASGGGITCGFDGYTTTPGRHEGIDIARGVARTCTPWSAARSPTSRAGTPAAPGCPRSPSTTRRRTRRSSTCTPRRAPR